MSSDCNFGNTKDCCDCARTERQLHQAVTERDEAEQAMSQAYCLVTGRSPEWSNHFGHKEALEEIENAMLLLKSSLTSDTNYPPLPNIPPLETKLAELKKEGE